MTIRCKHPLHPDIEKLQTVDIQKAIGRIIEHFVDFTVYAFVVHY